MIGRLIDLSLGLNRKYRVTIEIDQMDREFRVKYDELKDLPVTFEIRRYHQKRSKSANAYFHVLVNKIAAETNDSDDQVKKRLVLEYGAVAKDKDGLSVGFKLPASVDANTIYPYVKCFDVREENGKEFNCYLVYKQTHLMDAKEMARLIDGAISEAKELGIETDTPEQLAIYKKEWSQNERR